MNTPQADRAEPEAATEYDLSVVVACYNEAQHLPDSVAQLRQTLDAAGYRYELIFIDDCSRDGTQQLVAELCAGRSHTRVVYHRENVGRGGTVSEGFRLARGRVVGFLDIDLEVHCRFVPKVLEAIERGCDGATAYRDYSAGWQLAGIVRHILSQGYRFLFRRMFDVPFRDTETGFKFFRRDRVLPVLDEVEDRGWFWDSEVMIMAHRAGLRIEEVTCRFERRSDKTSTVRVFHDTWAYLVAMNRLRRRLKSSQS